VQNEPPPEIHPSAKLAPTAQKRAKARRFDLLWATNLGQISQFTDEHGYVKVPNTVSRQEMSLLSQIYEEKI